MLFVISAAIGTLGIPALTGFMNQVLAYLPNVLAALLIFIVAAAIAGAVGGLTHRTMGDTPIGKIVHVAAPALIMGIAVFMILAQLGIAPVIVTITYVGLIGSTALAAALAFGLGGRDAAAEMINSDYRRARDQADPVSADLATGRDPRRPGRRDGPAAGPAGSGERAERSACESPPVRGQGRIATDQRPPPAFLAAHHGGRLLRFHLRPQTGIGSPTGRG
jgi:hypothetical protein